jgi:hypothetical protein
VQPIDPRMFGTCNRLIPVTCTKHSGINGLHSFLLHVSNILGSMGCTHSCGPRMFGTCNRNECSPLIPECLIHVTGMSAMGCTHSCYMYQTFWDQWAALIPVTCTKLSGINGLHSFLLHVPNILGSMGCTHSCGPRMFGTCNRNECSPLIPECLVHVTGMSAAH